MLGRIAVIIIAAVSLVAVASTVLGIVAALLISSTTVSNSSAASLPEVVQSAPSIKEAEEPAAEESAPVQESSSAGMTGNSFNLQEGKLDLSNPFGFPTFVGDPDAWMADTPENREAAVSAALGITVSEIADEAGVAYAFNADGIALSGMPLIENLLYHAHVDAGNGRIVYFAGDGSTLDEHDTLTGDTTVRIAGFLAGEVDANGNLCLPYYNAVAHDTMLERVPMAYGYFADNCMPVPEIYISEPTRVETFHMLLRVTGADLTPMGEREGVWYFRTDLEVQSVTCPEGWYCLGTTDDVASDPVFVEFDGTAVDLTAAYLFDTDTDTLNDVVMSAEDVTSFIEDYRLTVEE